MVNVWLVEENETFRSSVAEGLFRAEDVICPREFAGADAAFDALEDGDPPDVILMDLQLRGCDGIEVVRRLKALAPSCPIVVLTDSDDPATISSAILAGASGYLLKTSSLEKIAESIRDVHEGGASMNPRVAQSVLEMFRQMSPRPPSCSFTPREQKIIELMTRGLLMKEIADELTLSYHTVDTHFRNIYSKLRVHTRSSAVARILREGLI